MTSIDFDEPTKCLSLRGTKPVAGGQPLSRRLPSGQVVVAVTAVLYVVLFSTFSIIQHRGLKTQMNDLGNADQALWAAAKGDWAMTQSNTIQRRAMSRLAIHANLIFWPLSLGYRVWPDPEWLLVLSSIACGAAGLGLYEIARRRLGHGIAATVVPLAFYASPIVHDANLYDFHTITLATAFLVWTVWAFDTSRPRLAWSLWVGALLCQEDMPFVGVALGFWLWWKGSRRHGVAIAGASIAYLLAVEALLVPALTGEKGLMRAAGDERYGWLGSSPVEIVWALLTEPALLLRHVFRPDRLRLPLYLALCGGIVALRSWPILLLAVPQLVLGMLSGAVFVTSVTGTYYWILCEATIIMACIDSAHMESTRHGWSVPRPLVFLATSTALFSLLFSPLPYGLASTRGNYALPPERKSLEEITTQIPADASLCVQNNLGAHLSQRPMIVAFRNECEGFDYAVFHLRWVGGPNSGLFARSSPHFLFGQSVGLIVHEVSRLMSSPDWGLLVQKDGFYLFARNQPSRISRAAMIAEFARDLRIFERQLRDADEHRWELAQVLTGPVGWNDLAW
jgi:uncharacterized membrane protein